MFLKQPITAVLSGSITWRLRGLNKPPFVNKAPLIRAITEATGPQGHAVHDKYPPNRNNLPTPSKQTSIVCVCVCVCACNNTCGNCSCVVPWFSLPYEFTNYIPLKTHRLSVYVPMRQNNASLACVRVCLCMCEQWSAQGGTGTMHSG